MLRIKHQVLIVLTIFLSACATPWQQIEPKSKLVDLPPLGVELESELGETLVQKGIIYTYDGLQLEEPATASAGLLGGIKADLQPSVLRASKRDVWRIYYSSDKQVSARFGLLAPIQLLPGGLAISHTNENDVMIFINGSVLVNGGVFAKCKPVPKLTKIQIEAFDRPSFRQELIFNGRTGDTLKFLYREISNSQLRSPFSQDIQYDLKDGSTIGFKGVRIEVLKATNTKIKYRVINSFPDSP